MPLVFYISHHITVGLRQIFGNKKRVCINMNSMNFDSVNLSIRFWPPIRKSRIILFFNREVDFVQRLMMIHENVHVVYNTLYMRYITHIWNECYIPSASAFLRVNEFIHLSAFRSPSPGRYCGKYLYTKDTRHKILKFNSLIIIQVLKVNLRAILRNSILAIFYLI